MISGELENKIEIAEGFQYPANYFIFQHRDIRANSRKDRENWRDKIPDVH